MKKESHARTVIGNEANGYPAPPWDLSTRLGQDRRHSREGAKVMPTPGEMDPNLLEKICILLRAKTGHDFSRYKKKTLYRRIERRMSVHQFDRLALYEHYLQENPQEVELLFRELLIGVTSFFRDSASWEQLRIAVLPALLATCPANSVLRAWSAGCSTGEEAYSLAMTFLEARDEVEGAAHITLQIFATDLDRDGIDRARQGLYPPQIAEVVSEARLHRFFCKEEKGYRVSTQVREMVTFATQNVIMDPPFTRLDLLLCRNLLIYLDLEVQEKLLRLFHYCLKPGGVIFFGSAEAVGSSTELFEALESKSRFFRRRESLLAVERVAFPGSFVPVRSGVVKEPNLAKPVVNLKKLADQLLLQQFTPPAVLVNDQGDILYISGRIGKYLEPAAGKANWNIFALVREGLQFDLENSMQRAILEKKTIVVPGLQVKTRVGVQFVNIAVQVVAEPEAVRGMMMIVFSDVVSAPEQEKVERGPSAAAGRTRIHEGEEKYRLVRAEVQNMREEMRDSQEKLTAANEELQCTNEELQSTNEELATSREEMQSLNEELEMVNAEQHAKIDEMERVDNDLRNLCNNPEILTVILDHTLRIRRFTTGADKLFALLPGDLGRPFFDIAHDLCYPELQQEVGAVLTTLEFSEKQVATTDGRWFAVRINPYRTAGEVIAGVVLTFVNITAAKNVEQELRAENARLRSLLARSG